MGQAEIQGVYELAQPETQRLFWARELVLKEKMLPTEQSNTGSDAGLARPGWTGLSCQAEASSMYLALILWAGVASAEFLSGRYLNQICFLVSR